MKSRLFVKLLISLLATLGLAILVILTVVNWSFQRGFVLYAQQQEIDQVRGLAESLSEPYAKDGNWAFVRNDRRHWSRLLESAGIIAPPRHDRPPPRRDHPPPHLNSPQPPERLQPDLTAVSVPLAHRIILADAKRQQVIGPRIPILDDHWFPVHSGGETVGWLGLKPVEIVTDQLARSFIDQQRLNLVWIALAGLGLSVLLAMVWGRWFLRPIQRVIGGAKQLVAGNYAVSVPVTGRDELAELAANFNRLANTLDRNEQLRRQWIVDISHELRTPIAVIGGEVEALLDGIRKPSPERLNSLYSDIRSLTTLVDDLHQLSLADQASLELRPVELNLYDLLGELRMLFEPRMAAKGLALELKADSTQALSIHADRERLVQLFSNLLENSLRYTDEGGTIQIGIQAHTDRLVIMVQDSAPGVPESDLERIFERLYRVDRSRSRTVGGSGLGLAICRQIVDAHGGQISAAGSRWGGLSIRIELPRHVQQPDSL